jgi:hypothetical protein
MGKSKGKKRKAIEDEDNGWMQNIDLPNVDLPTGWIHKLLALGPDLPYVLATLSTEGDIPTSEIKKAKFGQPFYSSTRWKELAPSFGVSADPTMARIDAFPINAVLLPPSFHQTTAEAAWHILDVFQEHFVQHREEARIRVFDAVWPIY